MNWANFFNPLRVGRGGRRALRALSLSAFLFVLSGCDEAARDIAPDFTLQLFGGGTFSLSEHRGHPVVINFFASWCIPCKAEAPALDKVYRDNKINNVVFLGIAIQDTEEKAMKFVAENGITFPAGLDKDSKIKESFGVFGVPMTFFIDRDGLFSYTHAGLVTEDLIRDEVDNIL